MTAAPLQHARYSCMLLCALLVCTVYTLGQFIGACVRHDADVCQPAEDFIAFYTEGQRTLAMDVPKIYDVESARHMLDTQHGGKMDTFLPLLYPPQGLLFLSILGFFSYYAAFAVWYGVPLLMLVTCLRSQYIRNMPGVETSTALLIFLPFLLVVFLAGQNGMLWVSLMIMVLMWRKAKPILSGLALSCFSIKPHLGVFLPLLLLYEKNGLALVTAVIATLAMAALSTAIWGVDLWGYYRELLQVFAQIEKITPQEYIFPAASPFMAFRMTGLNTSTAFALQLIISLTVLVTVWKTFRHCREDWQVILLIPTAGLLFSTYSYIYDDILLALPCVLLFGRLKQGAAQAPERIALILMAFIPIVAIKLHHMYIPYSFIAILFSFITTVRLINRSKHAVLPA